MVEPKEDFKQGIAPALVERFSHVYVTHPRRDVRLAGGAEPLV